MTQFTSCDINMLCEKVALLQHFWKQHSVSSMPPHTKIKFRKRMLACIVS